ncbi:unnamed protein product [Arctogadus glacialis]
MANSSTRTGRSAREMKRTFYNNGAHGQLKSMSKRRARLRAEAIHFISSGSDKPCYEVKWINDYKGCGVFACAPIEKGSFVLEYRGELISQYERDKRQGEYTEKQNAFLFDFEWNNGSWCLDASCEDGSLGRLVNDANRSPNCKMRKMTVQCKPDLCLFAMENIQAESEITYNYGESLWPWRALTPSGMIPAHTSADPQVNQRSTSSFQQTPSGMIPAHTSADPQVNQRSTSSFQQTPSGMIPAHTSADPQVNQRSTSSFQQTPSGMIPAHTSADPQVNQRSTSSFQQASKSSGTVPSHQCPTAEQTSTDLFEESSDATDYDDADYVPDSCGNSSDASIISTASQELKTMKGDSATSSEVPRTLSSSKMSSNHCTSVISCSANSLKNTSQQKSSINVTPLPITAKGSKYNKKQLCLYCKRPFLNWQDILNPSTVKSLMLQWLSVLIKDPAKEASCYALLRREVTLAIMLKWQAVALERWLLVEDPVLQNNLMTSVTANFAKDCMQETLYGDM